MRLYKFLEQKWALEDIRTHRIRISEIHDLNDPFELVPFDLSDPEFRRGVLTYRDEMNKRGLLCFSRNWSSPLLWAHYADKHKGICLGFDWTGTTETLAPVDYRKSRLPRPKELNENVARQSLFTKSVDWKYEKEVRVYAQRDEEENGNYFARFDDNNLKLCEVIVGHRCCTERGSIFALLALYSHTVKVIKARPSYESFEVIEDQNGFAG